MRGPQQVAPMQSKEQRNCPVAKMRRVIVVVVCVFVFIRSFSSSDSIERTRDAKLCQCGSEKFSTRRLSRRIGAGAIKPKQEVRKSPMNTLPLVMIRGSDLRDSHDAIQAARSGQRLWAKATT